MRAAGNPENIASPSVMPQQVLSGCYGAACKSWTDAIDSLCSALVSAIFIAGAAICFEKCLRL